MKTVRFTARGIDASEILIPMIEFVPAPDPAPAKPQMLLAELRLWE
jgi:hypothetical protein